MLLPSIFGENLFDDFFDDVPFFDNRAENQIEKKLYGRHAHNVMKTDIKETDDNYELIVDLPGFKKEDVKLDLDNGYLTISAQRIEELDDKDNEGRYIRQARATGSCARSVYVGKELEPKDISAKFENGILTLHLPKAEAKKLEPKQTLIEIE